LQYILPIYLSRLQYILPIYLSRLQYILPIYLSRLQYILPIFQWCRIKLANFLQLIGTIRRTTFKKVRTETVLKIYNTLVLPTFLYGLENWTLTALHRRRIEAAEMKLLRPLAGYTIYDHKTNEFIRCELRITGILDKIDEYRRNWLLH